jgi:hypothetical protein
MHKYVPIRIKRPTKKKKSSKNGHTYTELKDNDKLTTVRVAQTE